MTNHPPTRYELQLDVLERNGALSDSAAIALLRREFAHAVNAGYFSLLSEHNVGVDVLSRETPQDGVARYSVVLELDERTPNMTDEQAAELVCREFRRAQNASHFARISVVDFCAKLIAREVATAPIAR